MITRSKKMTLTSPLSLSKTEGNVSLDEDIQIHQSLLDNNNTFTNIFATKKIGAKDELNRAKKIIEDIPDDISNIIKDILHVPECEIGSISKLSPFVSHRIEQSLLDYLNKTCSADEFVWKRYEGKFPDIQLVTKDKEKYSGYGLEIKVICSSCEEPSARFWHNANNFKDYESEFVVILAWNLSGNNSGYPYINNTICINAKKLAEDRDKTIYQPPRRLICVPTNIRGTKKNLKKTDIKVLIFQENDEKFQEALDLMKEMGDDKQNDMKKIAETLTSQFKYREDSNAGKLNRIKNDQLVSFIKSLKT